MARCWRDICETVLTEIENQSGHRFVVENLKWRAVDESDNVDVLLAEVFDKLCQHEGGRCHSPCEPDSDYCYARLIVQRYGGKITKTPPFDPPVEGRIY